MEYNSDHDEIAAYLDQLSNYTSSASLSVSTNRIAVDVLLNQKYQVCLQKGVNLSVRLDDLSGFPLPHNALVVLVSNLLDNAIEACGEIPEGNEKRILARMSVQNEECMIAVDNSVAGPVDIEDNTIKTTKPDGMRHGYGMRNIKSIVSAYDGYCTFRCDGKIFRFAASFPGARNEREIG